MEWLNKLRQALGRTRAQPPAPRAAQRPQGPEPLERALPGHGPTLPKNSARAQAEELRFPAFPEAEELTVRAALREEAPPPRDVAEQLALRYRRCASDIAAQEGF